MTDTTLACPDCAKSMEAVRRRGVVIDHCGACGGHWFDKGELTAWVTGVGGDPEYFLDIAPEAGARKCRHCGASHKGEGACVECGDPIALACPRDGSDLLIIEEQGIQIDVCLDCHGIWFDGDELTSLAQRWLDKAGADDSGRPCEECGLLDHEGRDGDDGKHRCRDCHHDHVHGDNQAMEVRRDYAQRWSSSAIKARDAGARKTLPEPGMPQPDDSFEAGLARTIAKLIV